MANGRKVKGGKAPKAKQGTEGPGESGQSKKSSLKKLTTQVIPKRAQAERPAAKLTVNMSRPQAQHFPWTCWPATVHHKHIFRIDSSKERLQQRSQKPKQSKKIKATWGKQRLCREKKTSKKNYH